MTASPRLLARSGFLAAGFVLLAAVPAIAAEPGPQNLELACGGAFAKDSSFERLATVFGKENVRNEDVAGAEGETAKATVIYPDDARRRVQIFWWDEAGHKRPSSISVNTETSDWRLAGFAIGAGLAEVAKANGKVMKLSGFDWDYGGQVTDWGKGKLAAMPGGCSAQMTFATTSPGPDRLSGDSVVLRSNDKAVLAVKPKLIVISIGWPEK